MLTEWAGSLGWFLIGASVSVVGMTVAAFLRRFK
jgi:hypothetical protein